MKSFEIADEKSTHIYIITMSAASHAWARDYFGGQQLSPNEIAAPLRWLLGAIFLALLAGQMRKCLPPLEKRSRLKGPARTKPKVATGVPVTVSVVVGAGTPAVQSSAAAAATALH